MADKRELSLRQEGVDERDLAILRDSSLITPEQSRQLAVATKALPLFKRFGPVTKRHFNVLDTKLAIKDNAPIKDAQDVLARLHEVWEGTRADFHRYREIYHQGRVALAKLNKMRTSLEQIEDPDDREILQAEIDLEQVRLEALETELAEGKDRLEGVMAEATRCSERYEMILHDAGVDQFTEEDFVENEIDYCLKTAWYAAATSFREVDTRDKWGRPQHAPQSREEEAEMRRKAQQLGKIHCILPEELILYFESLGISQRAVESEVAALKSMRYDFDIASQGVRRSFADHFQSWLKNMARKYRSDVEPVVRNDMGRLRRIQQMLDPNPVDQGKDDYGEFDRSSATW